MNYYEYVDYTLLRPNAVLEEYIELCETAIKYNCKTVCVPPAYVKVLHDRFETLDICTVVGFPLGYSTAKVKEMEAIEAVKEGANEIDMVVNIGDVASKDWGKVKEEVSLIKTAIGDKILKVIIETSYLSFEDVKELTEVLCNTDCDFIKTSTGFSSLGAEQEKTKAIVDVSKGRKDVKASGGIRDFETFNYYISIGCKRIGVSNINYLEEERV